MAELLCQAVFKELLLCDGMGLMNLWTNYEFDENTKYAFVVGNAVKKLKNYILDKRILKGGLCDFFPSATKRQYLQGDGDEQEVLRCCGMSYFNRPIKDSAEIMRSTIGVSWIEGK